MMVPVSLITGVVMLLAKHYNFNINATRNPNMDIRVRRDVDTVLTPLEFTRNSQHLGRTNSGFDKTPVDLNKNSNEMNQNGKNLEGKRTDLDLGRKTSGVDITPLEFHKNNEQHHLRLNLGFDETQFENAQSRKDLERKDKVFDKFDKTHLELNKNGKDLVKRKPETEILTVLDIFKNIKPRSKREIQQNIQEYNLNTINGEYNNNDATGISNNAQYNVNNKDNGSHNRNNDNQNTNRNNISGHWKIKKSFYQRIYLFAARLIGISKTTTPLPYRYTDNNYNHNGNSDNGVNKNNTYIMVPDKDNNKNKLYNPFNSTNPYPINIAPYSDQISNNTFPSPYNEQNTFNNVNKDTFSATNTSQNKLNINSGSNDTSSNNETRNNDDNISNKDEKRIVLEGCFLCAKTSCPEGMKWVGFRCVQKRQDYDDY